MHYPETEHVQSVIDDMLSQIPSAGVVILGDLLKTLFYAHNAIWLTIDHVGRAAFDIGEWIVPIS